MAITSAGYDQTVTEASWAALAGVLGCPYGVGGAGDCAVAGVAGTRTTQVAAGSAFGWGVTDSSSTPVTLTHGANSSGSTRYDTVVCQRDWSTNTTSFVVVAGGSTPVLASLTVSPGTLAQQPLAIVPVADGATSLDGVPVVDYRSWAPRLLVSAQAPLLPVDKQLWMRPSGELYVRDSASGTWTRGAPAVEARAATDFRFPSNGYRKLVTLTQIVTKDGAVVVGAAGLQAPTAGYYEAEFCQRFVGSGISGTAGLWAQIRRNSGGNPDGGDQIVVAYGSVDPGREITVTARRKLVPMAAGDIVQAFVYSSLANVIAATAFQQSTIFSLTYVRGL